MQLAGHTKAAPAATLGRSSRIGAAVYIGVAIAIAVIHVPRVPVVIAELLRDGHFATDVRLYLDAARDWLATGALYPERQLAGPYQLQPGDILYPPGILWLVVPFLVIPEPVWWAIPAFAVGVVLIHLRPAWWAWVFIALALAWPTTIARIITGNPVLWIVAALAVGVVYAGPAVFVLLKPSLAPFALWGLRHRRWWLWFGAFALACVPFGSLWLDWLRAVTDVHGSIGDRPGGWAYSVAEVPMLLVPVVAWLGRRRRTTMYLDT